MATRRWPFVYVVRMNREGRAACAGQKTGIHASGLPAALRIDARSRGKTGRLHGGNRAGCWRVGEGRVAGVDRF